MTIALCQSNKRVSSARLIRVSASTRRGLILRSMNWASCFRRTKFSARISTDGRNRSRTSLTLSENSTNTIRTSEIMAQIMPHSRPRNASYPSPARYLNFCGPQGSLTSATRQRLINTTPAQSGRWVGHSTSIRGLLRIYGRRSRGRFIYHAKPDTIHPYYGPFYFRFMQ